MASRSLGVLTLDLIARTAGLVSGMTAGERQVEKSTKKIKNSFDSLKGHLSKVAAGLGIAAAIRGIVANTVESENAVRQLEAVTGGFSGAHV